MERCNLTAPARKCVGALLAKLITMPRKIIFNTECCIVNTTRNNIVAIMRHGKITQWLDVSVIDLILAKYEPVNQNEYE